MHTAVLVAGERHPLSAAALYDSFGSSSASGWLLGAVCDGVRPGSAVSAQIPLDPSGAGATDVHLLGRISTCVPGSRITIVHDQPWRGRIHLRFKDDPDGCVVTVSAELDDAGLNWWMEQRGWRRSEDSDPDVHRIGLLTSKTGPGAVLALSCDYLARLAVEQLNDDGGIGGRRVELMIHDDATDAQRAGIEARQMVRDGCRAIIASVTSASFEAVRRAVASSGLPLIHPVLNEGGRGEQNVFRWGERPLAQIRAAAPLMRNDGADHRWFHIGNDYSWSHGAQRAAVRAIDEIGGAVVGHGFTRLGTTDFEPVVDRIRASGARTILSSLVGADEVAFQRQLWESGLRETSAVLSLVMEESTREQIGIRAAEGIWSAFGYYSSLQTEANDNLRRQYARAYGRWAPPISTFSEAVYEAIFLYASVADNPSKPVDVARGLRCVRADLPRGRIELEGPQFMRQQMHVARSSGAEYRLNTI